MSLEVFEFVSLYVCELMSLGLLENAGLCVLRPYLVAKFIVRKTKYAHTLETQNLKNSPPYQPKTSKTDSLQHIQHLLFNLFQLVFHHHNDVLHLSLVALRARCVNLATHLLCDEPQFFTLFAFIVHGLGKIF